jgi:RHS repeat-associated protein
MHGDRAAPSGGTRTVTVDASLGSETVYDEDQFAGMVREQTLYNGVDTKPVSKTVNVPWRSPSKASRTINGDVAEARYVNTRVTYNATALGTDGSRGWRTTSSVNTFDDDYGTLVQTQDNGDTAKTGDEKCVAYTYNRNTTANIVTLPSQVTTTATTCGVKPASVDQVITDARTYYDNAASLTTAPTRGLPTKVEGLKDWSATGGTVWQTTGTTEFDPYGRSTKSTDIKGNWNKTTYAPATSLVTKETSSNHLSWATVTDKNPYWGATTKVTDPNGRVTEATYDPLGRVTQVWEPGLARASNASRPSSRYSYYYDLARANYPYVKSETINAVGGYDVTYEIYDGFLRPRQVQTQIKPGERVVTDTIYDEYGRVERTYGAYSSVGAPSGSLWVVPGWSVLSQNRSLYDRAGRVTDSIFMSGDNVDNIFEQWRTTTSYEGDRTTVTPPKGGTKSTTITDAQGRTVDMRQYTSATEYVSTKYTYNRKDQLTRVKDTAGNEWSYTYDAKGRRLTSDDPDGGLSTVAYNDYNEQISTTDALGKTLQYTYDSVGRKTATLEAVAGADPVKRAEWIYDRTADGLTYRGQLTQSIRYDNGNAYKYQARDFNARYQATIASYAVPTTETGLGKSYDYNFGYSAYDGSPTTITYPSAGNLASETVTTSYDTATGLPSGLKTAWAAFGSLVTGQVYSSYGEPTLTETMITGGVNVQESTFYDPYTRRIDRVQVKPETSAGTVSERHYDYDDAGNIVGIADTPGVGEADRQCFQQDALQRLTTAWTPSEAVDCETASPDLAKLGGPAPYWTDWTFDDIGNRTSETSHTTGGNTVTNYAVPASGPDSVRPHSVSSAKTIQPGASDGTTVSYEYDALGNTTARPGSDQKLTWDIEGHLASVKQGDTVVQENVYDADGNRLLRRDTNGQTLYLPGMEIRRTVSGSNSKLETTRYYTFNGKTVAQRTGADQSLTWLFNDQQGTQQIAVNAFTQKATIRRQTPYGTERGTPNVWINEKSFVGGDKDPTGLIHIGAREYDPGLGRFLSVDPLQDLTDPQQWNAYAYANNSPVSNSDPTGAVPLVTETPAGDSQWQNDTDSHLEIGSDGKWGVKKNKKSGHGKGNHASSTSGGTKQTAKDGVSDEDARRAAEIRKKNAIDVIIQAGGQILMDFFGITDIINCATKGDIGACAMTVIGFMPWGKAFKALEAIPAVVRAGKAVMKWMDEAKWAKDIFARLQKRGLPDAPEPETVSLGDSCAIRQHSFDPTTRVLMADGTSKPISDIEIGNKVTATDPETGKTVAKTVTVTHVNKDTQLTDLIIRHVAAGGDVEEAVLRTTPTHPFWDKSTNSWIDASELVPGQSVLEGFGAFESGISAVRTYVGVNQMYDLTVADIHTYYVIAADRAVLVHNCGGGAVDLGHLTDRVDDLHALIPTGGQRYRTTGLLHADGVAGGIDLSAVGARSNLTLVQRANSMDAGELAISMSGKVHAEVKLVTAAQHLGVQPGGIAASRPFCTACSQFLAGQGATIVSPRTALWLPPGIN